MKCPPNEDKNEWIAVNTVDFYNEINMLYGSIAEFCTKEGCPAMTAGQHTYLWADGVKIKKPVSVSAPEYVDLLMQWVSSLHSHLMFFYFWFVRLSHNSTTRLCSLSSTELPSLRISSYVPFFFFLTFLFSPALFPA